MEEGDTKTLQQLHEEEQAEAAKAASEHAEMWARLDGKNPFDWPEDARNLYQRGCTCSLWGRSVEDMSREQLVLFIAYVDTIASDLYGQCRGLSAAIEMAAEAKKDAAAEGGGSGDAGAECSGDSCRGLG